MNTFAERTWLTDPNTVGRVKRKRIGESLESTRQRAPENRFNFAPYNQEYDPVWTQPRTVGRIPKITSLGTGVNLGGVGDWINQNPTKAIGLGLGGAAAIGAVAFGIYKMVEGRRKSKAVDGTRLALAVQRSVPAPKRPKRIDISNDYSY